MIDPVEPPAPAPGPSVVAESLRMTYGANMAVNDISFTVDPGELFGFLGPNGAGKSTTIKILSAQLRATGGRASILGYDVAEHPLEVKRVVGLLPETINTYERLTGAELLRFTGRMHGLDDDVVDERAEELFELLALDVVDRRKLVIDYSMGMKKKVILACALIHRPRVLFLDEPFSGIDVVTAQRIRAVLQAATRQGVTIFFSSHVMDIVERLCTRLAIIDN